MTSVTQCAPSAVRRARAATRRIGDLGISSDVSVRRSARIRIIIRRSAATVIRGRAEQTAEQAGTGIPPSRSSLSLSALALLRAFGVRVRRMSGMIVRRRSLEPTSYMGSMIMNMMPIASHSIAVRDYEYVL